MLVEALDLVVGQLERQLYRIGENQTRIEQNEQEEAQNTPHVQRELVHYYYYLVNESEMREKFISLFFFLILGYSVGV